MGLARQGWTHFSESAEAYLMFCFALLVFIHVMREALVLYINQLFHQQVHVCVDNSNILIGLRRKHPSASLSYATLRRYVLQTKPEKCWTRCLFSPGARSRGYLFVAGSISARGANCESVWKSARDAGFQVHVLSRLETGKEQGVDESVHYALARCSRLSVRRLRTWKSCLTCRAWISPDVIALVTGDGNANEDGVTSFLSECQDALHDGLSIEIYAFSDGLSHKYRELEKQYSQCRSWVVPYFCSPRVRIFELDPVAAELCHESHRRTPKRKTKSDGDSKSGITKRKTRMRSRSRPRRGRR